MLSSGDLHRPLMNWFVIYGLVEWSALASMAFRLQLFHLSDPSAASNTILDDIPRLSAVLAALRGQSVGADANLTLGGGDTYLPGLFFSASKDLYGTKGIADIEIQNQLGLDAAAIGNHEFDDGADTFAELISGGSDVGSILGSDFRGTTFPYLSSNLDFSSNADLSPLVKPGGAAPQGNSITSSTVITRGGEKIGVIGATTPGLAFITSTDGVTARPVVSAQDLSDSEIEALAVEIQSEVDAVLAANPGLNKVVLTSHLQILDIEKSLAQKLRNVDIIMAGGSEPRLVDSNDRLRDGDTKQGDYPQFFTNAGGTRTAVVSGPGDYSYLGRLVIDFDASGNLLESSYDPVVSGNYATDAQGVVDLKAEALVDPEISKIVNEVREQIASGEYGILGYSDVFLNATRSGTGKATDPDGVRTQETNLGNLTADANLAAAKAFDPTVVLSIKNGGGIRASIGDSSSRGPSEAESDDILGLSKDEGAISQNDIKSTLAFNNGLRLLTLTRQEIVGLLEHGIGALPDVDGRFPQVSGVKFSFDPAKDVGSRIQDAFIHDDDGAVIAQLVKDGQLVGDAGETFRIVTLDFLSSPRFDENGNYTGAGDSYPFPNYNLDGSAGEATVSQEVFNRINPVDLKKQSLSDGASTFAAAGTEQDALAEFLKANHGSASKAYNALDLGAPADARIVNLGFSGSSLFAPVTPTSSIDLGGAEIVTWLKGANVAAVSGGDETVRFVKYGADFSDPEVVLEYEFDGDVQSVASYTDDDGKSYIAVAMSKDKTKKGHVGFYEFRDNNTLKEKFTNRVGYLPDSVAWSENGRYVVVANEGEPNDFYGSDDGFDPEGSISVFRLNGDVEKLNNKHRRFNNLDASKLLADGVRLSGLNATENPSLDLEPEYVTISPDNRYAFVTLQENNAVAKVDLKSLDVVSIKGLGSKNWDGLSVDTSNKDGGYQPGDRDFNSLYMPDGMDSFIAGDGKTYVLMANEGDGRVRPDDVNFEAPEDGTYSFGSNDAGNATEQFKDPLTGQTIYVYSGDAGNTGSFEAEEGDEFFITTKYGAIADDDFYSDEKRAGKLDGPLDNLIVSGDGEGRLKTITDQNTADSITAFGGRSFSIRDANGNLVWDSGDQLDRIAADYTLYDDGRSDDKGVEPEHVEIVTLGDRSFAFIALERATSTLIPVYEITDVNAPKHVHTFYAGGSLSPEASVFVKTDDESGQLLVSSEVSGTLDAFKFNVNMV